MSQARQAQQDAIGHLTAAIVHNGGEVNAVLLNGMAHLVVTNYKSHDGTPLTIMVAVDDIVVVASRS